MPHGALGGAGRTDCHSSKGARGGQMGERSPWSQVVPSGPDALGGQTCRAGTTRASPGTEGQTDATLQQERRPTGASETDS